MAGPRTQFIPALWAGTSTPVIQPTPAFTSFVSLPQSGAAAAPLPSAFSSLISPSTFVSAAAAPPPATATVTGVPSNAVAFDPHSLPDVDADHKAQAREIELASRYAMAAYAVAYVWMKILPPKLPSRTSDLLALPLDVMNPAMAALRWMQKQAAGVIEQLRQSSESTVNAWEKTALESNLRSLLPQTNWEIFHMDYFQSSKHDPAFSIIIDHTKHWVILCIRGTLSFNDLLTDVKEVAIKFYDGHAHQGMQFAAVNILNAVAGKLGEAFAKYGQDYKLVVTGHSLGGGMTGLVAAILRKGCADFNAASAHLKLSAKAIEVIDNNRWMRECISFSFAPPSILSEPLATESQVYNTSVVYGDDPVPGIWLGVEPRVHPPGYIIHAFDLPNGWFGRTLLFKHTDPSYYQTYDMLQVLDHIPSKYVDSCSKFQSS